MFKLVRIALAVIAAISATRLTYAASDYPDHAIQLIVAYPAGGGTDLMARIVANALAKNIGQSVVVINRPGAAGVIGTAFVAHARPDGYTLLFDPGNVTLRPAIDSRAQYSERDFAPVALLTQTALALVVPTQLNVRTVSELIEYCHTHSGQCTYASTGPGSVPDIMGELMRKTDKLDWRHVPYQGASPALVDVSAGRVQAMFAGPVSIMSYMQDHRLQPIAVTSDRRMPGLESVPTMSEAGQPALVMPFWNGVMAPAGTPQSVIDKLSRVLVQTLQSPQVRVALERQGNIVAPLDQSHFETFVKHDADRWKKVIDLIGTEAVN